MQEGSPYKMVTLRQMWNKALKRAGVPHIELNQGGRHTWASREMADAQMAAMERIQKQLSHTSKGTQKHYVVPRRGR